MNINVIVLIIWLIAGVLNAILNWSRCKCSWVTYWITYASLIMVLVTKVIG